MLLAETSLVMEFNNDIYRQYTCQPQPQFNTLKGTVICPATAKHLDKYSAQNIHFLYETPADYKSITLPFIEEQSFSIQVCLKQIRLKRHYCNPRPWLFESPSLLLLLLLLLPLLFLFGMIFISNHTFLVCYSGISDKTKQT